MSFTLRSFQADQTEFNRLIGENYCLILREKSLGIYKEYFLTYFLMELEEYEKNQETLCYGFLITEDQKQVLALFKNCKNYIVNEKGKTFANITY